MTHQYYNTSPIIIGLGSINGYQPSDEYNGYGTWAALRTAFATQIGPTGGEHAREYYAAADIDPFFPQFKSGATGNGLIRAERIKVELNGPVENFMILESDDLDDQDQPLFTKSYYLKLRWFDSVGHNTTLVPVEVQNQLTGQQVVTSGGYAFAINADLFTTSGQLFLSNIADPNPPVGAVISIGKLTPIT